MSPFYLLPLMNVPFLPSPFYLCPLSTFLMNVPFLPSPFYLPLPVFPDSNNGQNARCILIIFYNLSGGSFALERSTSSQKDASVPVDGGHSARLAGHGGSCLPPP